MQNVQSGCANASGNGTTAKYSADHCPSANLLGKCSLASSGNVIYYYSGGSDTKASDQKACANGNGTWSDP